jgi:hypothetical protein
MIFYEYFISDWRDDVPNVVLNNRLELDVWSVSRILFVPFIDDLINEWNK